MASVNKVILIGNLTRDPEVRQAGQSPVCDISLAMNRAYTGNDGQKHEETTYVDVTLWGRQAELAGQYLAKGSPVYIEGRLTLEKWQSAEGENRSKLKVTAQQMTFLPDGRRRDDTNNRAEPQAYRDAPQQQAPPQRKAPHQQPPRQAPAPTLAAQGSTIDDDDIPF